MPTNTIRARSRQPHIGQESTLAYSSESGNAALPSFDSAAYRVLALPEALEQLL